MKWNYFKKRSANVLWGEKSSLSFKNLNYLPRWVILTIDLTIVLISFLLSFAIINRITPNFYHVLTLEQQGLTVGLSYLMFFFIFSTYSGLIRHSTFVDLFKVAVACSSSILLLLAINYLYYFTFHSKIYLVPFLLVDLMVTFTLLFAFRFTVKGFYKLFSTINTESINVLIWGVNDNSIALAEAISISDNAKYNLKGFISSSKRMGRIKIQGKSVFKNDDELYENIAPLKIGGVIIADNTISRKEKNKIVDNLLAKGLKVFNAPKIDELDGSSNVNESIKKIQIEDLLERNPIRLSDDKINEYLRGKTILVTGGAGSIGSEIVRQISNYKPKKILVLDQAESPLYHVEIEVKKAFPEQEYDFLLADVREHHRLESIFQKNDISVVFHAAAYKHVPLIEHNPKEAINVNVLGTTHLANLAVKYEVSKFVMVSTDKAVNPTNVMGASKRCAEMYVQSLQKENHKTTFITTRFGNVLGSNGSVIPFFKKQIEEGGPVTVTHKDIIRFFMTIPEACQLVLQAGTMGKGGEIFVFDMGKPVKIMNLAERMIRLSGFEPNVDIEIKVIGLRPGEKLYEELLTDESTTLPTHHEKIMVATVDSYPYTDIHNNIEDLKKLTLGCNDESIVSKLKEIVPEFKSNNSIFEALDKN